MELINPASLAELVNAKFGSSFEEYDIDDNAQIGSGSSGIDGIKLENREGTVLLVPFDEMYDIAIAEEINMLEVEGVVNMVNKDYIVYDEERLKNDIIGEMNANLEVEEADIDISSYSLEDLANQFGLDEETLSEYIDLPATAENVIDADGEENIIEMVTGLDYNTILTVDDSAQFYVFTD